MEYRPPLHLGVVAIEKGAFGSPSTEVAKNLVTASKIPWYLKLSFFFFKRFDAFLVE